MSGILIETVKTRKQLDQFIKFAWTVNADDPNWVAPLLMDRQKLLNKQKNPFFEHAEAAFFLAFKNGKIVGRIAAITNQMHNDFQKDNAGFFGFLEGINDPEVFSVLLNAARDWLKSRGKDFMMGPMNPSTNDEIGFLISGFDTPPYFMMTHNPPYYPEIMDELKYSKVKDVHAFYVDTTTFIHKKITQNMFFHKIRIFNQHLYFNPKFVFVTNIFILFQQNFIPSQTCHFHYQNLSFETKICLTKLLICSTKT